MKEGSKSEEPLLGEAVPMEGGSKSGEPLPGETTRPAEGSKSEEPLIVDATSMEEGHLHEGEVIQIPNSTSHQQSFCQSLLRDTNFIFLSYPLVAVSQVNL